jgi:hypothetical protein
MTTHSEPGGAGPLSTASGYPGALGVRSAGLASLLNDRTLPSSSTTVPSRPPTGR